MSWAAGGCAVWAGAALLLAWTAAADRLDEEAASQGLQKIIRAMTNQTKADSLNLPSNATSIRENITDTFSCENRTYGYYADVENECQLFHVCLPGKTTSGRNATYRWSFICPEQTVFNQEVLVCTRPEDSINCTESPMYYDMNMDIGKVDNDTMTEGSDYDSDKPIENAMDPDDKPVEELPKEMKTFQSRKRNKNKRGQSQKIKIKHEHFVKYNSSNVDSKILKEHDEMTVEDKKEMFELSTETTNGKITYKAPDMVADDGGNMRIDLSEVRKESWNVRQARRLERGGRGTLRFQADVEH